MQIKTVSLKQQQQQNRSNRGILSGNKTLFYVQIEINGMKYFACFLPSYRSVDTGRCGVSPLEGVADKQQSGEKRHCLQGRFAERLAWERGEDFPLLLSLELLHFEFSNRFFKTS